MAPQVLETPRGPDHKEPLVIERSLARPGQESTTRVDRGRLLYAEHGNEITLEDGVWLVPSQHDLTSVYEVLLGRRGDVCECEDFGFHGHIEPCKHITATTIARAKTFSCDGCGGRFPNRERVEVGEDSLTHFAGEELCEPCACAHGVL